MNNVLMFLGQRSLANVFDDAEVTRKKRVPTDARKRLVRKLLNTHVSMPVVFLNNGDYPVLVGDPPKLTNTKGELIRSYIAYRAASRGRNIVYHKSTRRIEVGEYWYGFNEIYEKTKN